MSQLDFNAIEMIRRTLASDIKEAIYNRTLNEAKERLESDFEKTVRPIIEKVSLKGLERVRDMMHMRDELHLFINGYEVEKPQNQPDE